MDLDDKVLILCFMALGTAVSSSLLGPTIRLAFRIGLIDKPDLSRKLHGKTTAYMGGAILWASMSLVLVVLGGLRGFSPILPILGALGILFAIGIVDDARNLKPLTRLVFQALAVGILVAERFVANDMDPHRPADLATIAVAMVLGLATVNAFNLIDGLDGLAMGLGMLTVSPLLLSNWNSGDTVGVAIALAFVSACAGLFRGNLHPARIFLGDAGSLLIGGVVFALALRLPGQTNVGLPALLSGTLPLVVAIPLIDMVVVVAGRLRRRQHPFMGDRTHLHHRLLRAGFHHDEAVGWIHMAMAVVAMVQVGIWITGASELWMLATWGLWVPVYAGLRSIEHSLHNTRKEECHAH